MLVWFDTILWYNRRRDDRRHYVKARNTYIPSHAPGVSDILGVLPGCRFLAVEVKVPKGKVSPHQQEFIDSVNQAGGLAFVARSLEDVEHILLR